MGLRALQVPILKATLTLPGEKAHFRRALNPRGATPNPQEAHCSG